MKEQIKAQYALLARPYLAGSTQPKGETLIERFGNSIQECRDIAGRKVHAIIEYDRPLYDFEVERFSLHPVNEPTKADLIQSVLTSYFTAGWWESHDGEFGISNQGDEGISIWGPRFGPCTIDRDPSPYDAAAAVVDAYLAAESSPLADFVRDL